MKAAIYARYSSDNQREESIDAQIRAITDFSKSNGYTIVKQYTDEALSAKTDNRPQFLQMIADAKSKQFDAIICHKLDRFARNRYDSAFYKKMLKENGVKLISVLENFDDSPESIILESVLEGMAEYYSANLAREVKKGLKENALECKHTGGKPPFGFDIDKNKKYIINENESKAIIEIFTRVNNKESVGSIVRWLNQNGYRTKYGTPFNSGSINAIIRNEKYKGTYVYGKNKRIVENGVKKDVPGDGVVRIEDGVPRIVSNDVWDAANKLYNTRQHVAGGQAKAKEIYLLSGIIKCGLCGASMCGNKIRSGRNKSIQITYKCNKRKAEHSCTAKDIKKDFIENLVLDELERVLTDDFISKYIDQIEKKYAEQKSEIPVILKSTKCELTQANSQLNNILNLVMNGHDTPTVLERLSELESKKRDLIDRISYYEKFETKKQIDREYVFNHLSKYSKIKSKSLETQKKAISLFVRRVIVYPHEIKVELDVDTGDHGSAPYLVSTSAYKCEINKGYSYEYVKTEFM